MPPESVENQSTAGKILHNSIWYGVEQALEVIVFCGASITVARYLGPEKMGYFSYINFFVGTITRTTGIGLAGATRKYMSDFLVSNEPGKARSVYNLARRYQFAGSFVITLLALIGVFLIGDPRFRTMSLILILGIIPGGMSWVPAQANNAFEDVYPNTLSAVGYLLTYAFLIFLSIFFHWDLIGVAAATPIARTVEATLRSIPLNRKLRKIPIEELSMEVKLRIRRYCIQAFGLQVLMSVVWDRSEMVFLRAFSGLEQIAFYSVSAGLADKLLFIPRTFAEVTGISLMLEARRDPKRIDSIVKNACRYLLFVTFPVHVGAAVVAGTLISRVYGVKYISAGPVMAVASILVIPRAFQEISEILMRAADLQSQLIKWLVIAGVFNVGIDYLLIKHYGLGAVGAAWGNGLAQAFGIIAVWHQASRLYSFRFPIGSAVRLGGASLVMGAVALACAHVFPGLPGVVLAVIAGVPTYVVFVKLLRGLEPSDRERLGAIGKKLPASTRKMFASVLAFMTPAAS